MAMFLRSPHREEHRVAFGLIQLMVLKMIDANGPPPGSHRLVVAMATEVNELIDDQH